VFYDLYVVLCNEIKKSPSAVAIENDLQKSSVTRWKNGGSPTDANIRKLADYFGVSVAYLRGETDVREQKNPAAVSDSGAPYPKDYDKLNEANRAAVDRLIADLAKGQSTNR